MSSLPRTLPPHIQNEKLHDLRFCCDPNCVYCQDLREAEEQLRQGQPITRGEK